MTSRGTLIAICSEDAWFVPHGVVSGADISRTAEERIVPYTYTLIDQGTGILFKGQGVVTTADVAGTVEYLARHARPDTRVNHTIVDFSDADMVELTPEDLREVIDADARIEAVIPRMWLALVAGSDLAYGILRMREMMKPGHSQWDIETFRTLDAAKRWLRQSLPDTPIT